MYTHETDIPRNYWPRSSDPWSSTQPELDVMDEIGEFPILDNQLVAHSDPNGSLQSTDQETFSPPTLSLSPLQTAPLLGTERSSPSNILCSRPSSSENHMGAFDDSPFVSGDLFNPQDFQWVASNDLLDCFAAVDNLFPVESQADQGDASLPANVRISESKKDHKIGKAKKQRLDPSQRLKVQRVRRLGACLRCRVYRETVSNTLMSWSRLNLSVR